MVYRLAQVNIARMLAPLTDPLMAGFVAEEEAKDRLSYLSAHGETPHAFLSKCHSQRQRL